jgi:hypothetical protein
MKLIKYQSFLQKYYLINESVKLMTSKRFLDVLKEMEDNEISQKMISLLNTDVNVRMTNLDLVDDNDNNISFQYHSSGEIKVGSPVTITYPGYTYGSYTNLFRFRELPSDYYPSLPSGTLGKIEWIFPPNTHPNLTSGTIYHFVSNEGRHCMIAESGISLYTRPQTSTIGRVVGRILRSVDYKFTDKDLEEFVNRFKSILFSLRNLDKLLEIVSGSDIRHWYSESVYAGSGGTIHNSCMRYRRCRNWFSVYTENPEVCSMLILKSINDPEKINARALIWKTINGETFMDRIYYTKQMEVGVFKKWAGDRGWYYKKEQNSSQEEDIINSSGDKINHISVKLEKWGFHDFPYMDTLKFLDDNSGVLSNIEGSYSLRLESTGGGRGEEECERCDGTESVECRDCNGRGNVDCYRCDGDGILDCDDCDGRGTERCSMCDGEGTTEDDDGEVESCLECDGSGKMNCTSCDGEGNRECYRCDGRGSKDCDVCDGNGREDCPNCT